MQLLSYFLLLSLEAETIKQDAGMGIWMVERNKDAGSGMLALDIGLS